MAKSTGPACGTESSSDTKPTATASRTAIVPMTRPDRYRIDRRNPKAAPTAVTLIVDGPGLPMTTTDARISDSSGMRTMLSPHNGPFMSSGPCATRALHERALQKNPIPAGFSQDSVDGRKGGPYGSTAQSIPVEETARF